MLWRAVIFGAALAAGGCSTIDDKPMQDARLLSPDAATYTDIQAVVSKALGMASVIIAPDVLTDGSTLIIDPPGMNNMDASGRSMARPDHFELLTDGRTCYLRHRQTGVTYTLKSARCLAAPENSDKA